MSDPMSSNPTAGGPAPQLLMVFNLVQDVAVLRPLIYLAHDDLGITAKLVCLAGLRRRDPTGLWRRELERIQADTGAPLLWIETPWQLWQSLAPERGLLVCASESELNNHRDMRLLVQSAPSNLITLTLQHGWECVGFLMNTHQQSAYGASIGMHGDVIASWLPVEQLRELRPLLRSRVVHTGPSILISHTSRRRLQACPAPGPAVLATAAAPASLPLICENLHSVRFGQGGQGRSDFLTTFEQFAAIRAERGARTGLRPHPGGQYSLRIGRQLPAGVETVNEPAYRLAWHRFSYGISAPSTVLIDMVANGLPAAVWVDPEADLDLRHLGPLPKVSSLEEWLAFDAAGHRERQVPLTTLLGPVDAAFCTERYRRLLASLLGLEAVANELPAPPEDPLARPLIVSDDARLPTVQICLIRPWGQVAPERRVQVFAPTQIHKRQVREGMAPEASRAATLAALEEVLRQRPSVVIFCRYVGPLHAEMLAMIRHHGIPCHYFIDDLLTAVPAHIGAAKQRRYGSSRVQSCLRDLLRGCDGVISANDRLARELGSEEPSARIHALATSCPGVVNPLCDQNETTTNADPLVMGYMGFDHDADLEMICPVLAETLASHGDVRLELIGPLRLPELLQPFQQRISCIPTLRNYSLFLDLLASRRWHVGLAPLLQSRFNQCKSVNKWIEYTSCGIVTLASSGVIYDQVCADGAGLLASGSEEWRDQLRLVLQSPQRRQKIIRAARDRLRRDYSPEHHDQRLRRILTSQASAPSTAMPAPNA
jgi:hypothetical protein